MKKWLDKYKSGGNINSLNRKVTCSNCGWSWKLSDGGMDPMTCHKCGGDIKMQNGGELDEYQQRGQVNFRDQLFQRNKPIIDATAAPILLPPNLNYDKKRVVNSSSAGLNKNQLKQVYKNLKTKADAEKKQEIEEYEASELFHKHNPVAQLLGTRSAPVNSVKPTPRELAYGLGAGINEFYDVPNIGIVNDFVNPLSLVSKGIISPWAQAPLQAQQSDSYLPYAGAALSTALTVPMVRPASIAAKTVLNPRNIYRGALRAGKFLKSVKPNFKSEIDWGKWNPETPNYPELINEYNAIEESTKKAGTWMKNPDGSPFQGTPEQFIQQQSSWFKKAFPEYHGEILNHNTNAEFNTIDESFFNKATGDGGYYGKGTYTHPNKEYTKPYGKNNYEFYLNSKNKGFLDKSNIDDAEYFKRSDDEILQHHLPEYENRLMNYELNPNRYSDNAKEIWLNKLNEQVKAGKISRDKLDEFTSLHNPQNGEVVIPFNNRVKSAIGNVGFFDMSNPNIYKSFIPATGIGIAAALQQKQQGGPIVTNRGQWDYPGQTTIIPSNKITMTGVDYPVLGVDNTGYTKMMQPGGNYTFPGQYVTEYPMMQGGGEMIKRADGSYSRRGLWDNIRANKGSGKAPTKQMLDQERKIRNQYQNGGLVYNVKEGDNLSTIAQNYNIPLNQLVQTNNIKNPDLILTGQKLIIPKNSRNNDAEMAAIADKRLKYFESQQLSNNKQKQVAVNNPYFVTATDANRRPFQGDVTQGSTPIKINGKYVGKKIDPYILEKSIPVAAGIAAAPFVAPALAGALPVISSAMSAPLTIGATTVPWLTPTTLIGAGFGLHGANQLGNQVSSGYYSSNAPTSEKIFTGVTTGLDMLGMPGAVEGLAAHVLSPLYRGALKTGQYVSDGSLPQGLKNVKSFVTQSKKDISEAITNIKNIEATRKLHLNDLNSNYQNDILGLIQDPEKIKAEELPTELSYLKNKFIKYFERKLNSRQLSDKFIEDKVFKSIYNQHGGKKKFWDKVNGFGDEQFTNDELKNLYNEISSKVPSKNDASTLINSEFSKLKKQQLYNPLSDAPLIQDFVANKFKLSKPEVLSETNFLDDEKETLSAIRALGKFKSINQSKKKIKNLLTIPEAVEQLYKHASKIDDSRLKSILPNISREDIITAYEKLKGSGSTVNNTNQQIPQIGNSLPQELTELDPYFRKLALHGHAQHNPSLFSNFVKNYQTSFVPSYNIDPISKSEKLIPLIGNTHHEFDIAPNPKFVNNSGEPEHMLIDVGHEENGVLLNPRVQFLQAIRDVENAKKGSKFIGSNSLSTDSYPIFNNMGVKFTKNGLVVPKFSGHMTGLNELGYATKNPDLAIKEINSQIEALEKLSGKTFPKAKYIKKNYLVPQIYFERLKYGGQPYFQQGGVVLNAGGEKEEYWRTKKPMVNDPSMDAISKVLLQRNLDKNFMQRAAGFGYQGGIPTRYIPGEDPNSDAVSTLLMSFGDNQVFPTIIQTGPNQLSYQPYQTQEYLEAPTWDVADYFATKGYKRAANDMYGMEYQGGGQIPTVQGDFKKQNKYGYWVTDEAALAKEAQRLNSKKVLTEGGSLIIFDDNWNIVGVDDNPGEPYSNSSSDQDVFYKPMPQQYISEYDVNQYAEGGITYKVKKGDNLTEIANLVNVPIENIIRINKIKNPDLIYPGQELIISEKLLKSKNQNTLNKNKFLDFTNKPIVDATAAPIFKPISREEMMYNHFNTPKQQHTLSKSKPQSKLSKAKEVILNPATAAQYLINKQRIPDNLSAGKRNILDYAADIVNPAFYINAAGEAITNTGEGVYNIARGNYGEGFGNLGIAGMNALVVAPFVPKIGKILRNTPNDLNFPKNEIIKNGQTVKNSKEFFKLHDNKPLKKNEIKFLNKELEDRGILEIQRAHPLDPRPRIFKRGIVPEDYNIKSTIKNFIPNILKGQKYVNSKITMGNVRINAFNQYLGLPTENTAYRIHSNSFKNGKGLVYTIPQKNVNYTSSEFLSKLNRGEIDMMNNIENYYRNPTLKNKKILHSEFNKRYGQNIKFKDFDPDMHFALSSEISDYGKPIILDDRTIIPSWDYITGTGGNAPFIKEGNKITLKDVWDINPLSRIKKLPKFIRNIDAKHIMGGKEFELNNTYRIYPKEIRQTYLDGGELNEYAEGGGIPERYKNSSKATNPFSPLYWHKRFGTWEDGGQIMKAQDGKIASSNTNDFLIQPEEYHLYTDRLKNCAEGRGCLEQAFNYYDNYIAPTLKIPSSWDIKEKAGISSGKKNPRYADYEESADSWDIHGLLQEKGAKKILAADVNSPYVLNNNINKMPKDKQAEYFRKLNLPVGAIIGMGVSGGTGEHYGTKSYNKKKGLASSNHSAVVIGYDNTGLPILYDYGDIVPITNRKFSFPITNITAPKETSQYTYDYLKNKNMLENNYSPLEIKTNSTEYDEDEYVPFVNALTEKKKEIANALGLKNNEYDELARKAAALALTETGGGDDTTIRWKLGVVPVPSYLTDKMGIGDTRGITQINTKMLFSNPQIASKLKNLGITEFKYDPWNPEHIAAATMALLQSNIRPQQSNYKKNVTKLGYDPKLSDAAISYYQWNQPKLLRKGEALGDSQKVKNFVKNYNLVSTNTTKKLGGQSTLNPIVKKDNRNWLDYLKN